MLKVAHSMLVKYLPHLKALTDPDPVLCNTFTRPTHLLKSVTELFSTSDLSQVRTENKRTA